MLYTGIRRPSDFLLAPSGNCRRIQSEFACGKLRSVAPRMPVDELQIELQSPVFHPGPEIFLHLPKSLLAGECFAPVLQAIARAAIGQVLVQRIRIPVGHPQIIDVQYRIAEPGSHQCVTDIMHVRVSICVPVLIKGKPGSTNFIETFGTEGGEGENTIFTQNAPDFGKAARQITHPG